jgi:hypothetical protein
MDPVKEAFAKAVQDAVEKLVGGGMPSVFFAYRGTGITSAGFEFTPNTRLVSTVRLKQDGGRGPRYFEVIVKERILCLRQDSEDGSQPRTPSSWRAGT